MRYLHLYSFFDRKICSKYWRIGNRESYQKFGYFIGFGRQKNELLIHIEYLKKNHKYLIFIALFQIIVYRIYTKYAFAKTQNT